MPFFYVYSCVTAQLFLEGTSCRSLCFLCGYFYKICETSGKKIFLVNCNWILSQIIRFVPFCKLNELLVLDYLDHSLPNHSQPHKRKNTAFMDYWPLLILALTRKDYLKISKNRTVVLEFEHYQSIMIQILKFQFFVDCCAVVIKPYNVLKGKCFSLLMS